MICSVVSSQRTFFKPRDSCLQLSDRSEVLQTSRQHCYQSACQIIQRFVNLNNQPCGFKMPRNLKVRLLSDIETDSWYWDIDNWTPVIYFCTVHAKNYAHGSRFVVLVVRYRPFDYDVIKWKHFPPYWSFVQGIHRSPVNSPNKGQWRGALMFSLIWAWINAWVNNHEAGDLRRHSAHYDVIVMSHISLRFNSSTVRNYTNYTINNKSLYAMWFIEGFILLIQRSIYIYI